MTCTRCGLDIEGELTRCNSGCMCGGREGRFMKDGLRIASVYGDSAHHESTDTCIAALKDRIAFLERK